VATINCPEDSSVAPDWARPKLGRTLPATIDVVKQVEVSLNARAIAAMQKSKLRVVATPKRVRARVATINCPEDSSVAPDWARKKWAFQIISAPHETIASTNAKWTMKTKRGIHAWKNAPRSCVKKMIRLTPSTRKMIQQRRQLDWPAQKTGSRELLLATAGAINEMAFGCTNVQTASMVTTGTGGILIAAPGARAVAHAPTTNSLRIHASNWKLQFQKSQKGSTQLYYFLNSILFAHFQFPFDSYSLSWPQNWS